MVALCKFKTQKAPFGPIVKGWLIIDTQINQDMALHIKGGANAHHYERTASGTTILYCHDAAATEPGSDGSLNETDFSTESEVEYTGTPGFIHSFTTETAFFNNDQSLDLGQVWIIKYNALVTNLSEGQGGFIIFKFYKRDSGNNDTLLFSKKVDVGIFYGFAGFTTTVIPSGMVTTGDRLRIRVEMGEEIETL